MIAFSPCPITMTTTHEEEYPLYAFSGLPTQTPTYPSVHFQMQQPMNSFNAYNMEQNNVSEAPSNYILEFHNSSKYTKHNLQLSTPIYSPTNTTANYFDLQPNVRSVKSESAASMLSSSRGSPLMGLGSSSDWTPLHGVGSNLLHQGHYQQQILVNDNFNYAALSLPEKPGCVGKSASIC